MNRKISPTFRMLLAALLMAISMVLPFFTGQIPLLGKIFLPMHIPIILCGLVCGWQYGMVVGFVTPVFRSFVFGAPQLYPMAMAMAFKLLVVSGMAGWLYRYWRKKSLYISLIISILSGRIVWGIAMYFLLGYGTDVTGLLIMWAEAVCYAVPGMVLQLLVVPVIVHFLEKQEKIL